jgi:hypothetical protein
MMPLGTIWKDISRLLFYGLLCAGVFFGVALVHWFVIPVLPIAPTTRTVLNYLLILPLMVLVHLVWKYALGKAAPNPYHRSKRSVQ